MLLIFFLKFSLFIIRKGDIDCFGDSLRPHICSEEYTA